MSMKQNNYKTYQFTTGILIITLSVR